MQQKRRSWRKDGQESRRLFDTPSTVHSKQLNLNMTMEVFHDSAGRLSATDELMMESPHASPMKIKVSCCCWFPFVSFQCLWDWPVLLILLSLFVRLCDHASLRRDNSTQLY